MGAFSSCQLILKLPFFGVIVELYLCLMGGCRAQGSGSLTRLLPQPDQPFSHSRLGRGQIIPKLATPLETEPLQVTGEGRGVNAFEEGVKE